MTDEQRWRAVVDCDSRYDGMFFYGVSTTGIFCRPSCCSKLPLQGHVMYFKTAQEAQAKGYRPCKRCRPDLLAYQPLMEVAEQVKQLIDASHKTQLPSIEAFGALGLSYHRVAAIFKAYYGVTIKAYQRNLNVLRAEKLLAETDLPVLAIASESGFESLPTFYRCFGQKTGISPVEYRRQNRRGPEHI